MQVASALSRIGQVFDLELGLYDENGAHRAYETAVKEAVKKGPKKKSGSQQPIANGARKPVEKSGKKGSGFVDSRQQGQQGAADSVEKSHSPKEAVVKRAPLGQQGREVKKVKKRRSVGVLE